MEYIKETLPTSRWMSRSIIRRIDIEISRLQSELKKTLATDARVDGLSEKQLENLDRLCIAITDRLRNSETVYPCAIGYLYLFANFPLAPQKSDPDYNQFQKTVRQIGEYFLHHVEHRTRLLQSVNDRGDVSFRLENDTGHWILIFCSFSYTPSGTEFLVRLHRTSSYAIHEQSFPALDAIKDSDRLFECNLNPTLLEVPRYVDGSKRGLHRLYSGTNPIVPDKMWIYLGDVISDGMHGFVTMADKDGSFVSRPIYRFLIVSEDQPMENLNDVDMLKSLFEHSKKTFTILSTLATVIIECDLPAGKRLRVILL